MTLLGPSLARSAWRKVLMACSKRRWSRSSKPAKGIRPVVEMPSASWMR